MFGPWGHQESDFEPARVTSWAHSAPVATPNRRLDTNVPCESFVDSSCSDCDACRWIAPATIDRAGEASCIHRQHEGAARLAALQALIACPTGSIGGGTKAELRWPRSAFPAPLDSRDPDGDVSRVGWHSEMSFGAASYLIVRPKESCGNVLVDSPRFSKLLVRRLEELGGVETLFLSHRDDVADHSRFHAHFGCRRILHANDVTAGTSGVALRLEGEDVLALDEELTAIPVPGHPRGSTCLLYRSTHIFTSDHLVWSVRAATTRAWPGRWSAASSGCGPPQ